MLSEVESNSLESVLDSGKLSLVESIAYYNLYLNKYLDQMVVSAGGGSPGPDIIKIVLGMLARDRFIMRFGSELDVPDAIIAKHEESVRERSGVLMQAWPEYPHEQIGKLINFAAEQIMALYKEFLIEFKKTKVEGSSQRMNLEFFLEYVEKNAVSDGSGLFRVAVADFATGLCYAFGVLFEEHFGNAE